MRNLLNFKNKENTSKFDRIVSLKDYTNILSRDAVKRHNLTHYLVILHRNAFLKLEKE